MATKALKSRKELAEWTTQLVGAQISTDLKECASGAIFCHLVEAAHPGALEVRKVATNHTTEADAVHNFRMLADAMESLGVSAPVDVSELVKAQPQVTLSLLQQIFALCSELPREPLESLKSMRALGNLDGNAMPGRKRKAALSTAACGDKPQQAKRAGAKPTESGAVTPLGDENLAAKWGPLGSMRKGQDVAAALRAELDKSRKALFVAEAHVRAVEEERDFYYGKLEMIEGVCSSGDDGVIAERVTHILQMPENEAPIAVGDH